MIVEIILIALSIIALIIAIVFNMSKYGEDRDNRISSALAILSLSIFLGMLINIATTPTIEEYIHGKVKVEINQVYENGKVVRCDTSYYKL